MTIQAPCFDLTPESIVVNLLVGQLDTICLSTVELQAPVASVTISCAVPGVFATVTQLQPDSLCFNITGVDDGQENLCFVVCDQNGNCDSTYVTVNVSAIPLPALPIIAVNNVDTTVTNVPAIINVITNDTLNGTLTSLFVLQQSIHGMVTKTVDNIFVYTPFNDFCDDAVPDSFQYVVCNANSCDTATVFIWVLCDELKIYTGFSPNGDQMNEYFVIDGVSNFPNNKLTIFNRWGNLVYFKEKYGIGVDKTQLWNGTWTDQPLPDGTYFFLFEEGTTGGKTHSGYVQIKR
jgi:gliding motility-associated-like protein